MEMRSAKNFLNDIKRVFFVSFLSMILLLTGCGADESTNSSVDKTDEDIKEEATDVQKGSEEIEFKEKEDIPMETRAVMMKFTCFTDGKFQYCVMFEYDTKGNPIKVTTDPGSGWNTCEYDQLGRRIKESSFRENGDLAESYIYEYDEAGNLTQKMLYSGSSGTVEFRYKYEYEYDEAENLIKEICNKSGGLTNVSEWHEYEYDEAGNKIKDAVYRSDGRWSGNWDEYEYDELGNKIKKISYDSDGVNYRSYEYKYDESGNLIKYMTYDDKGIGGYYIEFEYDESGNVIKKKIYNRDGNCYQEFEYNYSEYQVEILNINMNLPFSLMNDFSPYTDIEMKRIL